MYIRTTQSMRAYTQLCSTCALALSHLESPATPRSPTLVQSSLHQPGCLSTEGTQHGFMFINTCYRSTLHWNHHFSHAMLLTCSQHVNEKADTGQVCEVTFPRTDETLSLISNAV